MKNATGKQCIHAKMAYQIASYLAGNALLKGGSLQVNRILVQRKKGQKVSKENNPANARLFLKYQYSVKPFDYRCPHPDGPGYITRKPTVLA